MTAYQTLSFSKHKHIAHITLNRPDAANAINLQMARELMLATIDCEQDADVRAVLISANGKMFSAGGDVKHFAELGEQAPTNIRQLMVYLHAATSQLMRMQAPVIIAVNGMAAGAGFSLACAGDIVYAASSAKFTMAYTAIGLSPDGGASYTLPRLIGLRRSQELMLTNRRLDAITARDWGIVTEVVADEDLQQHALAMASQLAKGPGLAYASVKRLLASSWQQSAEAQMEDEARAMTAMLRSEDGQRGISSFVAKTACEFHGK